MTWEEIANEEIKKSKGAGCVGVEGGKVPFPHKLFPFGLFLEGQDSKTPNLIKV